MRKKPDRYGQSDDIPNKDHFFDDASSQNSSTDSIEYIDATEKDSYKADESRDDSYTNILRNQISRVEAKLDNVKDIINQLQRMVIALMNGSRTVAESSIPDLPLTTEKSVYKFESDLKDGSFRQNVVSNINQLLLKMFCLLKCRYASPIFLIY